MLSTPAVTRRLPRWLILAVAVLPMLAPSILAQSSTPPSASEEKPAPPIALVIHGGAGTIRREDVTPELEAQYRTGLRAALDAGYAVLERGGSSLEAVGAAIVLLEDSPLFNAGRGAVLNHEGFCELDVSLMDGRTLAAGAAAGVRGVKNPIRLARAVMEHSPHVMLTGAGAERFAREQGLEFAPDEYFVTEPRRWELERALESERRNGGNAAPVMESVWASAAAGESPAPLPLGTVGAVALDRQGHLAAGTSTGGMVNKRFGRVGDSPIIGAGTYAKDATCAVSCTGHGEFFIRMAAAHDVSARMEYRGQPVAEAAAETVRTIGALGGTGGLIAVDRAGNVALPFNTAGMYRAHRREGGEPTVAIFGDEGRKP